jgi:hypothetical protein
VLVTGKPFQLNVCLSLAYWADIRVELFTLALLCLSKNQTCKISLCPYSFEVVSLQASCGSTLVEHSPCHPKALRLGNTVVAGTVRQNGGKEVLDTYALKQLF